MFTIDFVTSREDDKPVERVEFDQRDLAGVVVLAESVLHDIIAGARRVAPVIGYLIRDEAGTVVRRLYKGLG
jgi:hypothetical protein